MDWRKIERVLIDAATAQGVHVAQEGGVCGVNIEMEWSNVDFLDFSKLARDLQFELEKTGA